MNIRNGFVTNSSSSSFILIGAYFETKLPSGKTVQDVLMEYLKSNNTDFDEDEIDFYEDFYEDEDFEIVHGEYDHAVSLKNISGQLSIHNLEELFKEFEEKFSNKFGEKAKAIFDYGASQDY